MAMKNQPTLALAALCAGTTTLHDLLDSDDTRVMLDALRKLGCVVRKHELNYLLPTYLGDELHIATWISANDGKLSTVRDYQIIRQSDGKTVFTGRTNFVTVDMVTGKPKRMPAEFIEAYIPALTSP